MTHEEIQVYLCDKLDEAAEYMGYAMQAMMDAGRNELQKTEHLGYLMDIQMLHEMATRYRDLATQKRKEIA